LNIIIGLVCLLVIPLLLIESYGEDIIYDEIDQKNIDELKIKILDIDNKLPLLGNDIEKQRTIIAENENEFENAIHQLEIAEKNNNDSWADIEKIIKAKKTVEE